MPAIVEKTNARSAVPPSRPSASSVAAVIEAMAAATMPRGAMAAMKIRSAVVTLSPTVATHVLAGRMSSTSDLDVVLCKVTAVLRL